jgi:hypothetical protein
VTDRSVTRLGSKHKIRDYLIANPHAKAFPKNSPAVFKLYCSPGQVRPIAHENVLENVLEIERFLMSLWHSDDASALISTEHLIAYADQLRIYQPGDAGFALSTHVDRGSVK